MIAPPRHALAPFPVPRAGTARKRSLHKCALWESVRLDFRPATPRLKFRTRSAGFACRGMQRGRAAGPLAKRRGITTPENLTLRTLPLQRITAHFVNFGCLAISLYRDPDHETEDPAKCQRLQCPPERGRHRRAKPSAFGSVRKAPRVGKNRNQGVFLGTEGPASVAQGLEAGSAIGFPSQSRPCSRSFILRMPPMG
jgi:hypothetical protein